MVGTRYPINAYPLICHLPELKDKPNYYNKKKQLPELKKALVEAKYSGEKLDFSLVYSTVLQDGRKSKRPLLLKLNQTIPI